MIAMAKEPDIRPADFDFADIEVDDIDLSDEQIVIDGQRLTDERADMIAADVLAKARAHNAGLVPGGKSLSGDGRHSPVVQVRVSGATKDKLRQIARERKMSVSKLSRQILDDFVDRHEVS